MNASYPFDVLLFDFGGVLIDYASWPRLLDWLDHSMSEDALVRKWLMSPAVRGFESGKLEADVFADAVVAEFGLPVTPNEFIEEFALWPRGVMPGVETLLSALHGKFTLASYSNTNVLHWERVRAEFNLLDYFDVHFPSHITGNLKPDREGFEHIVTSMGCPVGRILFFDDNPMNIEGARAVGIEAVQVDGPAQIAAKLKAFGIQSLVLPNNAGSSTIEVVA